MSGPRAVPGQRSKQLRRRADKRPASSSSLSHLPCPPSLNERDVVPRPARPSLGIPPAAPGRPPSADVWSLARPLALGPYLLRRALLGRRAVFADLGASSLLQDQLVLHEEVEDALSTGKPVVALETAILTHGLSPLSIDFFGSPARELTSHPVSLRRPGLPYPLNLEVTLKLSKLVREGGAVPATIALLAGVPTVGLTHAELQRLADPEIEAVKVSRRDLAPAMAFKKDGGTTVAGTMWLAQQAGIDVL